MYQLSIAIQAIINTNNNYFTNITNTTINNLYMYNDCNFSNCEIENSFKEDELRERLSRIGDSLVVVQDEDIVKVHFHT